MKAPIEKYWEPPLSEAQIQNIARKVQASRHSKPMRVVPLVLAPLALAAVLAIVVWVSTRSASDSNGPIVTRAGAELPETLQGDVTFSDGSQVSLEGSARAEVMENQASKLSLLMRRGRARFQVNPKRKRQWVIETGIASVEVVGTIFTVDRTSQGLTVSVERGVVLVRADALPDGLARVEAGRHIFVADASARTEATTGDPVPSPEVAPPSWEVPSPSAEDTVEPARPQLFPATHPKTSSPSADWRSAARNGDFETAWQRLEGGFEKQLRVAGRQELLWLADAARSSGHPQKAARALHRALTIAPEDVTILFTLGRLELEELKSPRKAAAHFAAVAQLAPGSPLCSDAMFRRVEALMAAGQRASARQAAQDALAAFPHSHYVPQLEGYMNALERD